MPDPIACPNRRRVASSALAWLLLAGCAPRNGSPAPPTPATPSFQLTQLRLEPPLDGLARAALDLAAHNPNPWPVAIEQVDYALILNGTLLGRRTEAVRVDLPPDGDATFTLRLPYADAMTVASFRRRQPPRGLAYALRGEAAVRGPGPARIPIRLEGTRVPLVVVPEPPRGTVASG